MLRKNRIPLLLALIIGLEAIIYFWAVFTTEPGFITDKCARNAGRASSALNLMILVMIGYYGLKQIYADENKRDQLRILITLFAANHLIHFFYVYLNFKNHTMQLNVSENKHGFVVFLGVVALPLILWSVKNLNWLLYICIITQLFNASYFIMETFYNKVKPDKPAYHNQFGIVVTSLACLYVLYSIFKENKKTLVMRRDLH